MGRAVSVPVHSATYSSEGALSVPVAGEAALPYPATCIRLNDHSISNPGIHYPAFSSSWISRSPPA